MAGNRLYKGGAASRERKEFERQYEDEGYSQSRADYIYGATVGKVHREQEAKKNPGKYWDSHRHGGYHSHLGKCGPACKAGIKPHAHLTGSRRHG